MQTVIAIVGVIIVVSLFLLGLCKANGNSRNDDEQEACLKEKKNGN